jgi:PAS domain S-box-containing protein
MHEMSYKALSELSNEAILFSKLDGRIIEANKAAVKIYGYEKDEFLLKKIEDLRSDSNVEVVRRNINKAKERAISFESSHRRKDGSVFSVEVSIQVVTVEKQEVLLNVIRDISRRKIAEEAMRESESKYKSLFYNMNQGFIYTKVIFDENHNPSDLEFLEVNSSFEEIFGIRSQDIIGKKGVEVFPRTSSLILEKLNEAYKWDKTFSSITIDEMYSEICGKWISITAYESQFGYIAAIVSDVTEKREAQIKLQTTESKYHSLIMNLDSAVAYNKIILDDNEEAVDYEYIETNDKYASYGPFTKEEIVGKRYTEVYPQFAAEVKRRLPLYADVALSGESVQNLEFYSEVSGRWYDTTLYSPEKYYFITIITDITARKNAEMNLLLAKEMAEEANKAKSQFLANMSHEIRTPLNGIIGMIELTYLSNLSDEQRKNLSLAKSSARSLLKIINDILDFSKIEAGKLNIEKVRFNFNEFIKNIVRVHTLTARSKGIGLLLTMNSKVPEYIYADPIRLKQILDNLLSNAVKFTNEGRVSFEIKVLNRENRNLELAFYVEDTGIGISDEEEKYLFRNFSQVDGSYTRRAGGTGLGLAISKQLAEHLGGGISVESEKGKGSLFKFICKLEEADSAAFEEKHNYNICKGDNSLDILLVEDDMVNQLVMSKIVNSCGHKTTAVNNGQEALDLMEKNKYDIIFMDIQMPVMDGVKTTRLIREKERLLSRHTTIIAVTAYALKGEREKFLEVGMDDYISKPVDMDSICKLLEKYSKKKQQEAVLAKLNGNQEGGTPTKQDEKSLCSGIMQEIRRLENAVKQVNYSNIEKASNNIIAFCKRSSLINIKQQAFQLKLLARREEIKEVNKLLNSIKSEFHKIIKVENRGEGQI